NLDGCNPFCGSHAGAAQESLVRGDSIYVHEFIQTDGGCNGPPLASTSIARSDAVIQFRILPLMRRITAETNSAWTEFELCAEKIFQIPLDGLFEPATSRSRLFSWSGAPSAHSHRVERSRVTPASPRFERLRISLWPCL